MVTEQFMDFPIESDPMDIERNKRSFYNMFNSMGAADFIDNMAESFAYQQALNKVQKRLLVEIFREGQKAKRIGTNHEMFQI